MTDLKQLIMEKLAEIGEEGNKALFEKAFKFLADNQFFGAVWKENEGSLLIPPKDAKGLAGRLGLFMEHQDKTKEEKLHFLKADLEERFPITMGRLSLLHSRAKGPLAEEIYPFYDFLAAHLEIEVHLMGNKELERFAEKMDGSTTKTAVEELAFFTGWMKSRYQTAYSMEIKVKKRTDNRATEAYDLATICKLYFFHFNEEYTQMIGLYEKACDDPRYADTILYVSVHLLCSLRDPDIKLLPLPEVDSPSDILCRIREGSLSEEEATRALRSVMNSLGCIAPVPNKTQDAADVPEVYLFVPTSLRAHFGKLFLICAAHVQISGRPFLSRKVSSYWDLLDLVGPEMAEPFRERDISPTAFSKSFMQGIALLAGQKGEGNALQRAMLGYQLASRARSHKQGYGSFAEATAAYLKDNALTGLGPSMIACELFERGVLSSIPSMLLSLVFPGEFEDLAFSQQTRLIQELGMDALQVERVMESFQKARARAEDTVREVLGLPGEERKEGIKSILHNMAAGMAPGKDGGIFCFMTALDRPCPFPRKKHCLGCRFRIDTRATLFQLGAEYKRLSRLHKEAQTPGEKLKYRLLLSQYLLPAIENALAAATEEYDQELAEYFEMAIGEAAHLGR